MNSNLVLNTADRWFRFHQPREGAKLRLICFPHAGGSPSLYQPWSRCLPSWIEVVSVQYPGHEIRAREPLIDDMATLVAPICEVLRATLDRPFALFGHSLGAAVAHEVAKLLQRESLIPVRLYVSARRAPQYERRTQRYLYDDNRLWSEVCTLGGTPEALQSDPLARAVVLPVLRNDYRLSETYLPDPATPLFCPVTAFVGDGDAEVTPQHARGWQAVSPQGFSLHVLQGGHFYLIPRRADLLRLLLEDLAKDFLEMPSAPSS